MLTETKNIRKKKIKKKKFQKIKKMPRHMDQGKQQLKFERIIVTQTTGGRRTTDKFRFHELC